MNMIEILKSRLFKGKELEIINPKKSNPRKGKPRSYSDNEVRSCQFNFKVTPSLYNRLTEASVKLNRTKSDIAVKAISEYLDNIK